MQNYRYPAVTVSIPSGGATSANQTTQIGLETSIKSDLDALNARLAGGLVPTQFDYIALTYVPSGNGAGQIQTATYKLGGSGGTTVATLTMVYDGQNRLISTTKT